MAVELQKSFTFGLSLVKINEVNNLKFRGKKDEK